MPACEPVPNDELNVLEQLVMIRNQLTVLKKYGSNYKPQEIIDLYDQLNKQVDKLLKIRTAKDRHDPDYHNRVDDVIDDVYQLVSLFWMALGKNLESPATYIQLISIEQCLDHLYDVGVYIIDDVEPFESRLNELAEIIDEEDRERESTNGNAKSCLSYLVHKKLDHCRNVLKILVDDWNAMSNVLSPIQIKLVNFRRELAIQLASDEVNVEKVKQIQVELREIDSLRINGKFKAEDGSIPPGQAQVCGLLDECFEEATNVLSTKGQINEALRPIYDRLMDMKIQLSKLYVTRRWTMRETDLWAYQIQLNEIDSLRKEGGFHDSDGKPHEGQMILHYLLQKCYRIIYLLLVSSEPVAESLMPVHNQLLTLRRCLTEVKSWGGPFEARELFPYQIKLASIDNLRTDGKFLDEHGLIPEGQAVVMALLNECYDIMLELKDMVEED